MSIEIDDIKHIRKKLGLTQKELATKSRVSQSMIAKIESNRLDPSYSNAKRILESLRSIRKSHEAKAGDFMTKKIISVCPRDKIKLAITKMKKSGISQLPVIEDNKSIGLVSESTILSNLGNKSANMIHDIMEDSPPVVSKKTNLSVISDLLNFYPLVLVSDSGKLKGVITKSDLIARIYK